MALAHAPMQHPGDLQPIPRAISPNISGNVHSTVTNAVLPSSLSATDNTETPTAPKPVPQAAPAAQPSSAPVPWVPIVASAVVLLALLAWSVRFLR